MSTSTPTTMPLRQPSFDAAASSLALLRALRSRNARHDAALSEIVRDYSAVSTVALEAQVSGFLGRRKI